MPAAERPRPRVERLAAQQMEVLRGRRRVRDTDVLLGGRLENAPAPRARVLGAVAFCSYSGALAASAVTSGSLGEAGDEELVDDDLRAFTKSPNCASHRTKPPALPPASVLKPSALYSESGELWIPMDAGAYQVLIGAYRSPVSRRAARDVAREGAPPVSRPSAARESPRRAASQRERFRVTPVDAPLPLGVRAAPELGARASGGP